MTTKPASLGLIQRVLILFVIINIIGDIGNVIFWWVVPSAPGLSLNTGYIGTAVGDTNVLIIGSVILLAVSVVYIVALRGLLKRMLWAPLLVIAISIVNRVLAVGLYLLSFAFVFWLVWTVILVVLAYLDWRNMKAASVTTA